MKFDCSSLHLSLWTRLFFPLVCKITFKDNSLHHIQCKVIRKYDNLRDELTCTAGEFRPDGTFLQESQAFYSATCCFGSVLLQIWLDKIKKQKSIGCLCWPLLLVLPPGWTKPKSNGSSADSPAWVCILSFWLNYHQEWCHVLKDMCHISFNRYDNRQDNWRFRGTAEVVKDLGY